MTPTNHSPLPTHHTGINPHASQPTSLAALAKSLWHNHQLIVQMARREAQNGHRGAIIWFTGLSGSGKSTLGRIAALLELGSGFNPEFSGRENVYMNAAVLGLSNEEIDKRFNDIVAFADIGDFIEQPVKTYSSGMLMRLAFAVVAHVDAEILIVDEALSVGDAVFVSHSLQSVLELCDRAIWLVQGDTHMDGEAKEVVRHYSAFVHQQINTDSPIRVETRAPASALSSATIRPINQMAPSQFRAEVFAFDPDAPYWGAGGAEIIDIEILDGDGQLLDTINGGAEPCLPPFTRAFVVCNVKNHFQMIGSP